MSGRKSLRRAARRADRRGFTLIELIIVIAVIGILAGIAIAQLRQAPRRAAEAALKENLFTMRSVIDQYYADKQSYPQALSDLVSSGYLRKVPFDPITKSDASWEVILSEEEGDDPDPNATPGIIDVRSGATETALDGTPYNEW